MDLLVHSRTSEAPRSGSPLVRYDVPDIVLGKGELEEEVLSHLNAELWRHSVAFTWQRGDVLCIDNEVCTHSRTSFEGPRKLFVQAKTTLQGPLKGIYGKMRVIDFNNMCFAIPVGSKYLIIRGGYLVR